MFDPPDWMAPASDVPLTIDISGDLDRWGAFLGRALGGAMGMRQVPGEPFFVEYSTGQVASRLWLLADPSARLQPMVVGDGERLESMIEPWRRAVAEATADLAGPDESFRWRAILGPSPEARCTIELAEAATVGGLSVRPGGVRHVALGPSQLPQYGSRSILPSWPFFVEGVATGYSWNAASRQAARDLHRLAGLVSLAWGHHWSVRHLPRPIAEALNVIPSHDPFDGVGTVHGDDTASAQHPLPSWVSRAWTAVGQNAAIANALGVYQEGMALRQRHASFAVVAFVAAIETVGASGGAAERCTVCKTVTGAAERFRAGLRRVMPEERARALAKDVYGRRSATAHAGALHGPELYPGAMPYMEFFGRPPEDDFVWSTARRVEEACRAVLVDVLSRGGP